MNIEAQKAVTGVTLALGIVIILIGIYLFFSSGYTKHKQTYAAISTGLIIVGLTSVIVSSIFLSQAIEEKQVDYPACAPSQPSPTSCNGFKYNGHHQVIQNGAIPSTETSAFGATIQVSSEHKYMVTAGGIGASTYGSSKLFFYKFNTTTNEFALFKNLPVLDLAADSRLVNYSIISSFAINREDETKVALVMFRSINQAPPQQYIKLVRINVDALAETAIIDMVVSPDQAFDLPAPAPGNVNPFIGMDKFYPTRVVYDHLINRFQCWVNTSSDGSTGNNIAVCFGFNDALIVDQVPTIPVTFIDVFGLSSFDVNGNTLIVSGLNTCYMYRRDTSLDLFLDSPSQYFPRANHIQISAYGTAVITRRPSQIVDGNTQAVTDTWNRIASNSNFNYHATITHVVTKIGEGSRSAFGIYSAFLNGTTVVLSNDEKNSKACELLQYDGVGASLIEASTQNAPIINFDQNGALNDPLVFSNMVSITGLESSAVGAYNVYCIVPGDYLGELGSDKLHVIRYDCRCLPQ